MMKRRTRRGTVVVAFVLASLLAGAEGMAREVYAHGGYVNGPVPIIPGVAGLGFGIYTVGGSGRHLVGWKRGSDGNMVKVSRNRVIKVTNLNPKGTGSFREAIKAKGPRVIIFEVSGTIDFSPYGRLLIDNPYLTIAGQTAPSPGITLKACVLEINTHDVLIQHIRIRTGDLLDPTKSKSGGTQWNKRDCMTVRGKRIVIDHCSFSWATNVLVRTRASKVMFRRNIFSECLTGEGIKRKHSKRAFARALEIGDKGIINHIDLDRMESRNVAVIGNLFAHNNDSQPSVEGGAIVAIINNFIYGGGGRPGVGISLRNRPAAGNGGGGVWASVIGNHLDKLPRTLRIIVNPPYITGKIYLKDILVSYAGKAGGLTKEHLADPWNSAHTMIPKRWTRNTILHPEKSKVTQSWVFVPGLKIRPSSEVRAWVLASAGARPADRDPVDARVIREVRTRTGSRLGSQDAIGGWPKLAENHRKLTVPNSPDSDDNNNSYTRLEEWLHAFADRVEGRAK